MIYMVMVGYGGAHVAIVSTADEVATGRIERLNQDMRVGSFKNCSVV